MKIKAQNLDKKTLIIGAGASVGLIQTVLFKQYIDPQYGKIPYIGDMLPDNWGYWSTGGNIMIGGILFAVTSFTSLISKKSAIANDFLQIYGLTTLVGGVMNGLFYTGPLSARAKAASAIRGAPMRLAPRMANNGARIMQTAPMTPTGIPAVTVLS